MFGQDMQRLRRNALTMLKGRRVDREVILEMEMRMSHHQHLYEINNNEDDVTPGRYLEARINLSRREAVNSLKADGMSLREIRFRFMSLARKYHLDKWIETCNFSKAQIKKN